MLQAASPTMLTCSKCGAGVQPSHRFCGACGAPFQVVQARIMTNNERHAVLVACAVVGVIVLLGLIGGLMSGNATPARICELTHVLADPAVSKADFESSRLAYEADCGSRQQPDMAAYNRCCERMAQLNAQLEAERARVQPAKAVAATPERPRGFPVFNGTQPACLSEEALDELSKALVEDDRAVINDIERRGICLMPKAGTRVSILEGIFTVKVRAITPRGSLIMWVPREGLGYE